MSSELPMTARQFWRAMLQTTLVTSVVTILLISGYLALLMRLPTEQWRGFAEIVGGLFLVLFALTSWVNQRYFGSVVAYLRGREAGEDDAQVLRTAFVDLSALPYRMLLSALFWWSLGGSVVAAAMALRYDTFQGYQGAVMVAAAASGGFVTSIFLYFIHKWIYAPLRSELAAEIADSEERGRLVHRVPLHRKLLVGVCGVTFVSVTFAMFLAFAATGRHLESFVANSQSALLSELVSAPEGLAGEALSAAEANARRLGIARHLILLDGESGEVLAGDPHALYESERRAVLRSKGSGDSLSFDSPNSVTWQRLDGGAVLVAALPWEAISGSGDGWIFALMIAFTASTSLGIAFTLARDVGTATRELSDEVQRLASGDLTAGRIFDSEDELGDLWRSVESMAAALRETVGRVALAADRVEGSSGSIARVSQAVAGGAAQQGEGVGQAIALMDGINGRVLEIAQSAQELNLLVEESSSSILEMGAAGEELNDTAGVLSSKTDEVSSSVEEMVRSVREVAGQTEVLSEASAETSASMEQMAAAMRQVDSTAEQSAKLSAGVIERAEGGHEKVRRTIEGMESIRAATETAERVIRGLGARTAEIGAILDVIDDVADETNLLALNAAIIAAQAGDHGRAFSVVADEIKELADRVLASTKEIGGLIRSVQQESANAVGAIEEGARSVASGVELSMQAGGALEEITSASRDSGDCMQEIVHAVREQTKAAGHVVGLMERVSEGIEAIRHASAEQERGNDVVSRSTVATREVAQQLRGTTEEQARGGARIRESTDGVREAVEAINRALQIQTESTAELASFLEQVATRSSANVESAGQMRSATDELSTESESLREQVARFRV